jgi:hypothetical protein
VAFHAGAVSYGRGAGGATPAPRYMDFLSLGFVANAMALLAVLDWNLPGITAHRVRWVTVVAWLVFAVGGIARLSDRTVVELAPWNQYFASHVTNIRGFVIGGDVAGFKSKAPLVELPFYDPTRLAMLMQEPFIQHILPSAVRVPIRIQPRVVAGNAFVPEGFPRPISRETLERSWGSLSPVGNRATGQFESQAMTCGPGGLLRFGVAGYVGQSNQRLQLRELLSGRELSVIASRVPKRDWLDAFVSCPHGPFEIVATDEDPATWFAFREPVEIGRGSWMAESLIANSMPLLFGALGLALVAARLTLRFDN